MTTDRIKEIQEGTAYPNSKSVQLALLQVWNECAQQSQSEIDSLTKEVERLRKENDKLIAEIRAKDIPNTDMDFGVGDLD
jgi:hypothetical protein